MVTRSNFHTEDTQALGSTVLGALHMCPPILNFASLKLSYKGISEIAVLLSILLHSFICNVTA